MAVQSTSARINTAEDDLRRDLAACYRLVAHFGWDDHPQHIDAGSGNSASA